MATQPHSEPPPFHALLDPRGRLYVVSGPSGVGKDAVLAALLATDSCLDGVVRCVTATTRPARPTEVDGLDYHFLDRAEFERRIGAGGFLEHALYSGHYYGTPAAGVESDRARGRDVILKIEIQGAAKVRERLPDAILVFLAPPSWKELERRLRSRATSTEEDVQRRLLIARDEMKAASHYNYLVVNDDLAEAASALRAIILAERARVRPQPPGESRTE